MLLAQLEGINSQNMYITMLSWLVASPACKVSSLVFEMDFRRRLLLL